MNTTTPGTTLHIFVGEEDSWRGQVLYSAIVDRALREGMTGATVTRGIEGYGVRKHRHQKTFLGWYDNLPVRIEIIDTRERIEAFIPLLEEMAPKGLITLHDCEVVRFVQAPVVSEG